MQAVTRERLALRSTGSLLQFQAFDCCQRPTTSSDATCLRMCGRRYARSLSACRDQNTSAEPAALLSLRSTSNVHDLCGMHRMEPGRSGHLQGRMPLVWLQPALGCADGRADKCAVTIHDTSAGALAARRRCVDIPGHAAGEPRGSRRCG